MNEKFDLLHIIQTWLLGQGMGETGAFYLALLIIVAGALIVMAAVNYITKKILLASLKIYIRRSATRWDDVLLKQKVFQRLAHIAPALVVYFAAAMLPDARDTLQRLAMLYMVVVGVLVYDGLLNTADDIYRTYPISRERPIKGYIQVIKIITYIFVGIYLVSTLLNRSPWVLLSGLGAMTAILLLIFKDSILGLVAGIQLTFNDMIRIGDWIEMPKYGADGDVVDITLNTVKVQNWDKTITTIPAYTLISDSFKNWRGMSESGGRRIKRAVNIDMTSIKFCDEAMLERFRSIQYISDYIDRRQKEIEQYNRDNNIDTSVIVNGRKMTNIGTFRAYVKEYLHHHPKIHQDMTFLIRQLKPTEYGLPIEIYVFSNDQAWANYEAIQADIFDHILAVVPEFDLRVYQQPSGHDLQKITAPV